MAELQRIIKLLRHCSKKLMLDQGILIHCVLLKMGFELDLVISNYLIDMYGKCCRTDIARLVFDRMPERNVVSWTALMGGYLQQGEAEKSLLLFRQMGWSGIKPNEFTFSMNLKACGFLGIPEYLMQIHVLCIKVGFESYPVVGNSIIDVYSKCGRIEEAKWMFDIMPIRNLISWNAMISGYANDGDGRMSISLFQRLLEQGQVPDEFTFSSVLKACGSLGAFSEGKQIHALLITNGFSVSGQIVMSSALLDLYVKCKHLYEARSVFDQIGQKNIISWTTMIMGYTQEGSMWEATGLFCEFRRSGSRIDGYILSNMVDAFADFTLVEQGKQIHCLTVKVSCGLDVSVANSLVDMYLKCGLTEEAERRFDEILTKNVISWTVMITGYGKHGYGKQAICLFEAMQQEKIEPDSVTYLAMLSACSHAGLIEESLKYFSCLCKNYRIKPRIEHYACMVDVLGRAGRLKEAKDLIKNMPLEPSIGIWQTLLGACTIHGDLEMGREVGEVLLRIDGDNAVNYVMMSNMYAEGGEWGEHQRMREEMKRKGLKKEAGCSWIEIDRKVHLFYGGGDDLHPLVERIHGVLREMERRMKEEMGYACGVRFAKHDVEEESKEDSLRVHSEKMAIGLGLVCGGLERGGVGGGGGRRRGGWGWGCVVIRVFKNLRVCGDCHEFMKGLSKVLEKKVVLIVRDANRFHRFEGGICSCRDYW
ncbi:hypothetical protein AAC387_Pa01g1159 [Persea americana]